jgi:hypothetical protein
MARNADIMASGRQGPSLRQMNEAVLMADHRLAMTEESRMPNAMQPQLRLRLPACRASSPQPHAEPACCSADAPINSKLNFGLQVIATEMH